MKSIKAPMGGVYRREFIKGNNRRCKKCSEGGSHGPYWYRFWWEGGKTRKEYIGKNLPLPKTPDEDLPKTEKSLPKAPQKVLGKALPKADEGVVERALEVIQAAHSRGEEPSVSEVSEAVGMESRPLGRLLAAKGLEAKNVRRGGVRARRYLRSPPDGSRAGPARH
jgi:hypothetical protein